MGSNVATSLSGILLIFVMLALAVATQCFSAHPRQADSNPALGDASVRTGFVQDGKSTTEAKLFQPQALGRFENVARWALIALEWKKKAGASRRRGSRRRPGGQKLGDGVPIAKAWPEEFTINFTTKAGGATGFLAYDWGLQRQMIFHGPNSTFCSQLGTEDACQMFENPAGTYVFVPSLEKCFLSVPGVGTVPPDWTTNSEYIGTEEVPGIGLCRSYAFPPTAHVWYETVVGSLPCVFVFPDSTMTYYFEPETLQLGTPDEKYFDLEDYCFEGAATKKMAQ